MNVIYCGVNRRVGISGPDSKNPGNPYDICELTYLVRVKPGKKEGKWTFTGHGHVLRSVPCNPDNLDDFAQVGPAEEISLVLQPQPENPERNWVVGFNASKAKAA